MNEDIQTVSSVSKYEPTLYEGEVSPDRYDIQGVYRRGGHSVIYRALDKETGNVVAIKQHEHYLPEGGDENAIRLAKERFEAEVRILSQLNHPGIIDVFGHYFKMNNHEEKPFLVTELIEHPSLEDLTSQGRVFDEEAARGFVLFGGAIYDHLHTVNGKPILYRDGKPGNFKVMPLDADWSYKLLDFSESKIGKATMSGSVLGSEGYAAPETLGGGIADQSTDFYSLMRIAARMGIEDHGKFIDTWFGNSSLRELREDGHFNVSETFLKAFERATERDPNHRYKTFTELAKDLGYNITSVPRTRQELEAVLAHKALSPEVNTRTKTKTTQKLSVGEDRSRQKSLVLYQTPKMIRARTLRGKLGKEFMDEFRERAERLGNPGALKSLEYVRMTTRAFLKGVVKGGNSFTGVLASEILRERDLRTATRPDLEKMLWKPLRIPFQYVGVGVALRTRSDSRKENDLLAKILYDDLRHRRINVESKGGKLISFNALSLERNSNSVYGLVFRLNDEATEEDVLNLGDFKWDYLRNEGLSQAFFDWDLGRDWYSYVRDLAYSDGDGRVVAVGAEGIARQKKTKGK